jgi:hypothetical protein
LCLEADRELPLDYINDLIDIITAIHFSQDAVIDFAFFVAIWLDRYYPHSPEHQVRPAMRTGSMNCKSDPLLRRRILFGQIIFLLTDKIKEIGLLELLFSGNVKDLGLLQQRYIDFPINDFVLSNP